MKKIYVLGFLLSFLLSSCDQNGKNKKESSGYLKYNGSITELTPILFKETKDSITFNLPLILPIHIFSSDSTIMIYDLADQHLKQFYLNGNKGSFNPMQEGPSRISGANFRGVGYIENGYDNLLIATNTTIKEFNFSKGTFKEEVLDSYTDCVSFNSSFYEVFSKINDDETIFISQNGNPCYSLIDLGDSVTPENFWDKTFVRIKTNKRADSVQTLRLPELKNKNTLYERFRLYLTYNKESDRYYGMLNPLNYLFEYRINLNSLELELTNYWDLTLPQTDLPINYFIEKVINTEMMNKALDYNFELNFIDSFGDYIFISYHPSKDIKFDNPDDAPYSSHYFLAVLNLKDKLVRTYSLNYDEIQYFGTSNGNVWFYDVVSSELSGQTKFRLFRIDELLSLGI
ncbi:hypothetical protein [Algoriphagus alkaliphilus]|nr:hypothetical protein [Algoriphagus alkaliphilus]MBA4299060.1 hypothetical protein [Cyclobacterium sp.]